MRKQNCYLTTGILLFISTVWFLLRHVIGVEALVRNVPMESVLLPAAAVFAIAGVFQSPDVGKEGADASSPKAS